MVFNPNLTTEHRLKKRLPMKWSDQAETAIKKIPFFVRKKVRTRVEKEAAHAGKSEISLSDVKVEYFRH
jgi:anaerobic sulfite reductase subunit C